MAEQLGDMAQLVGIADDVDRGDAPVAHRQRRGLEHVAAFAADIARQAVDRSDMQQPGRLAAIFAVQAGEQPQDAVHAVDRIAEGEDAAAAVGVDHHILGEQCRQRRRVAVARRREEGTGDPRRLAAPHRIALPRLADVTTRPRRKLPHRGRRTVERRRHLGQRDVEHVVEQEGGALQRRQAFERQHQRQREIVRHLLRPVDDEQRLGQPRADIGLAAYPRRFEMIEAQARDDPRQPCRRRRHRIRPRPAQPGVLYHVLRLGERTGHPIGEAEQPRPLRLERRRVSHRPPDAARGSRPVRGSRY
ncbi:hypothetical protein MC45_15030 [Sphingomonas taxi]|uniref:Uncharacterized protein n=1 Tax=Sphingomonas taxi TaxID=1549858 RepID=A0A097EIR9_9SPHN|nr:hypothetical protein MC45_15030 [Sphingomonas taxi]